MVPPAASSATATRSIVLRPPVPPGPPVRIARRARVRMFVPVGVLVVFGGLGTVAMVLSGEPLVVALGLTGGALVLLGCGVIVDLILRPRAGRIEVATVGGGLELPPIATALWIGPVGAVLALLLAGILVVGGMAGVDLGPRRFTSPGVGFVLAVIVVVGILRSPPAPSRVPRIVLTPDGIGRRRGQPTRLVGWDEIAPPEVVTDPGVQVVLWKRIGVPSVGARPAQALDEMRVVLPLGLHASDPNLVLALIEHYRTHPGDRAELAGPEVIDRLRRGELEPWR